MDNNPDSISPQLKAIPVSELGSLGMLAYGASGIIAWKRTRNKTLLWKDLYIKLFKTDSPEICDLKIRMKSDE